MITTPNLISPLTVRGKLYPNRLCSAPSLIGISMRPDGTLLRPEDFETKVSYALGGCGAVCIGETHVDGVFAPRGTTDTYDPFQNPNGPEKNSWRWAARRLHDAGALALVQLMHAGSMRTSGGEITDRPVALGPMSYTRDNGEQVKAADEADMQSICDSFARTAVYMQDAGFDGVMVHGGHGWLLTQFLSPATNQRTDAWGGTMKKRCAFPVRVIRAIREAVGDNFILEMRVSGEETAVPGGYGVEQVACLAQQLEGILDIIHISNGHYNLRYSSRVGGGTPYDPHICNLEQAVYVKQHTKNMLVNVVGAINNAEDCDRLIGEGKLDLVSMAKQLYADVNFGNKCKSGHAEEINRCVRCQYCYCGGVDKEDFRTALAGGPKPGNLPSGDVTMGPGGVLYGPDGKTVGRMPATEPAVGPDGRPLTGLKAFLAKYSGPRPDYKICTVNPAYGLTPPEGGWPKVTAARKVLIVGGGPAGLQAAIAARDRGHNVVLIDAAGELGGALNLTDHAFYKQDLNYYRDQLKRRVADRRIDVRLNCPFSQAVLEEVQPDVILAAVGAERKQPPIAGLEHGVHLADIYRPGFKPGAQVVVIGGGQWACEGAIELARTAKNVTVLKLAKPELNDSYPVPSVQYQMDRMKIQYVEEVVLTQVQADGVATAGAFYPADTIVWFAGTSPKKSLVDEIRALAGDVPVKAIGDCKAALNLAQAGRAGYVAAMELN